MPQAGVQTEWSGMFTKGQWHYQRTSFQLAGQDSFTDAPAQNEDMFVQMTNVLPPLRGDVQRRWGYSIINGNLFSTPPLTAAATATIYTNFNLNQRYLIWSAGLSVAAITEAGATYNSSIFTPAGQPLRSASSRGFQYFASGVQADLQKWDGSALGGMSKWGIDINQLPTGGTGGGPNGPNPPTPPPGMATGTSSILFTGFPKFPNEKDTPTAPMNFSGFGFAVTSTLAINGIVAQITASDSLGDAVLSCTLLKNGALFGSSKSININTVSNPYTVGSTNDTWGGNWTAADINNSAFGIRCVGQTNVTPPGNGITHDTITISSVNLTVQSGTGSGSTGAITLGAPVGGSITLVNGRTYFIVFKRSGTLATSDLSSPSPSTGILTNQNQPLSNLPISADPQVDSRLLLATSDGGDQTLLYLVAQLDNVVTTYTDSMPDTTLVTQPVYLETDDLGNQLGVAANTPPPANLMFPLVHRGRVYGAALQNLFYSKAESELLTTTGTLAGHFEECWPGLNYFTVTAGADTVTGLLSDGQVLYIGTTRKVIRLFGDGPNNYTIPEALFTDVGVLNQDVWKMVFLEGNPLGTMWLTPDYHVIGSDFNTYQDVGSPVQNILDSINIAAVKSAWAIFTTRSIYAFYMLAVPTGSNTHPDTLLVFDLRARKWYVWKLADVALGGLFNITQAGIPTTYFMAADGTLYTFDPTQTQDRVGNTPVNITSSLKTSFIALVDPTARKYLNEIEVGTADPNLLVSVAGASTMADFQNPHPVVTNANLVVKPRGEFAVMLAGAPARDRYYQYSFTSNAQTTNVLGLMSVEGGILHHV